MEKDEKLQKIVGNLYEIYNDIFFGKINLNYDKLMCAIGTVHPGDVVYCTAEYLRNKCIDDGYIIPQNDWKIIIEDVENAKKSAGIRNKKFSDTIQMMKDYAEI